MAESPGLRLEVFTHPSCSGCPAAVDRAWRVTRDLAGVELGTVSLETEEGLAAARARGVTTIPTLVLSAGEEELERWIGTPDEPTLVSALRAHTSGTRPRKTA